MTAYSNLRQNPFTLAFSDRTMDPEIHSISEFFELPGIYGIQLQDRPKSGTIVITENVTGGSTFVEVTSGDPASGQYRVDYVRGLIVCSPADSGVSVIANYTGRGTNFTLSVVQAIVATLGSTFTFLKAALSSGLVFRSENDTTVATFGIGNTANVSFAGEATFAGNVTVPSVTLAGVAISSAILTGQITELNVSNNATDSAHDLDFTDGYCSDENRLNIMFLNASTKRFDAAFATGSGNGAIVAMNPTTTVSRSRTSNVATVVLSANHGLNIGAVVVVSGLGGSASYNGTVTLTAVGTNSISYAAAGGDEGVTADTGGSVTTSSTTIPANANCYVFAIKNTTTQATDIIGCQSFSNPTYPSGFSVKRLIFAYKTDGSANITQFINIGNTYLYLSPILDVNVVNLSTTATTYSLSLPSIPGGLMGIFNVGANNASSTTFIYLRHPSLTDAAIASANANIRVHVPGVLTANRMDVEISSTSTIRAVANQSSTTLTIGSAGFMWDRSL